MINKRFQLLSLPDERIEATEPVWNVLEANAQRAVYRGLGSPKTMSTLKARLQTDYVVRLAVRSGIHSRPVMVGEIDSGGRHEILVLGETPNIAARFERLLPTASPPIILRS